MNKLELFRASVRFSREAVDDIAGTVLERLRGAEIPIPVGGEVAVAVGSRGIANLRVIVGAVCAFVREKGARPFIVPAMGSHGGATAQGQEAVLAGYGITQEDVGAPIRSSMQTVELDRGALEHRLFMDKEAYNADGVIVIGRVKPHTDFSAELESGLAKMCVIGLGKHKQALECHSLGAQGLSRCIGPAAGRILATGKILCGLAVVENAYDETAALCALRPEDILRKEKELLVKARALMGALPAGALSLLIVDTIGKDISGTGMDTNVIGRRRVEGMAEPASPRITHIVADDLTPASHGNALGVGLADFITRRLYDKIDFPATYENTLTSTFIDRARIPLVAQSPRQAVQWALRVQGGLEPLKARIIRIRSTRALDEILVSSALVPELSARGDVTLSDRPEALFTEAGELKPF